MQISKIPLLDTNSRIKLNSLVTVTQHNCLIFRNDSKENQKGISFSPNNNFHLFGNEFFFLKRLYFQNLGKAASKSSMVLRTNTIVLFSNYLS